jgi:hypothetical protein
MLLVVIFCHLEKIYWARGLASDKPITGVTCFAICPIDSSRMTGKGLLLEEELVYNRRINQ